MSLRVADRVDDWDQRPVEGGYAGLSKLADEEFSGVVRAAGAALYMTAGTVVGIEQGNIADFEGASGTAYQAPVPALPLLCVMQAADADVRAQYYTEETPISEVDTTLSDGGFTGYLELAENVLSGDYFLVYHGGTSTAVGFVGAAERLISGDEAYETAADEVGIYKVRQVDVEPIEIPEPADEGDGEPEEAQPVGSPNAAESEEADADEQVDNGADVPETPDTDDPTEAAADDTVEADESTDVPSSSADSSEPADGSTEATQSGANQGTEPARADRTETTDRRQDAGSAPTESSDPDQSSGGGSESGSMAAPRTSGEPRGGSTTRATQASSSAREAADLETRSVPSLDPQRSTPPGAHRSMSSPSGQTSTPRSVPEAGSESTADPAPEPAPDPTDAEESTTDAAIEQELAEREAEIERLESELATAREERDDLAGEVERLEAEIERLEERLGGATDADRRLSPGEAIAGTNLFVEYDSKSEATLERAASGSDTPDAVAENLRLGVHTEFESEGASVDGQPFNDWLRSTLEYRFAEWLVGTLLFEIRDTGHSDDLADLFEAIPEIRRVEFDGVVDVETEEGAAQERFDVIFRHRMGDPLVVANLNDDREPASGGMMERLVTAAERVGRSADSLSTAVLVSSSFFASEALETVSDATQGGILSRDKRTSFVNLSRKQGYHLCLVAAREGNFHLEVPEL